MYPSHIASFTNNKRHVYVSYNKLYENIISNMNDMGSISWDNLVPVECPSSRSMTNTQKACDLDTIANKLF